MRVVISRIVWVETSSCFREHFLVVSWPRSVNLILLVFAVWYFREEVARVSLRVELPFCFLVDRFVLAGTWVHLVRQLSVFNVDCRFEEFSLLLRCLKITSWPIRFCCVWIRIVECRADCIVTSSSVHVR